MINPASIFFSTHVLTENLRMLADLTQQLYMDICMILAIFKLADAAWCAIHVVTD